MKRILLSISIIISFITVLGAQCDIEDLTVTPTGCNANGEFSVTLKFNDTDIDLKTYIVQGNGTNYGSSNYVDGITIDGLDGNCVTPYEFTVRDEANPSCGASITLGIICCADCKLEGQIIDFSDCDVDGNYTVEFEVDFVPSNSPGYTVFVDGNAIDFHFYNSSPQQTTILHDGGATETVIICDRDDPTCCDTITYVPPCVCDITNMKWDIIDCDEVDSTFSFIIDADFQSVSDSFTIGGNATNYGTFAFTELPIVIGPFDWDDTKYDFVMADITNLFCFDFIEPGTIELCPPECDLANSIIDFDCNSDDDLEITVTIDNVGLGINGYSVIIDGIAADSIYAADTTITYIVEDGICNGMDVTAKLQDLYYPDCNYTEVIPATCCNIPCTITDITAEVDCSTDLLTVGLVTDADASEPVELRLLSGNTSFTIGIVTVADFPFTYDASGLADGTYVLEVFIDTDLCEGEVQFDIDCTQACIFGPVNLDVGPCNPNGNATITVNFDAIDVPGTRFLLETLTGMSLGDYAYDDLPISINVPGDCSTIYDFIIIDVTDGTCSTTASLQSPICCACDIEISSVFVDSCQGQLVDITLTVNDLANNSSTYTLAGNGNTYGTFSYANGPVTVSVIGDCSTIYEFVATDSDDNTCNDAVTLNGPLCCTVDTCDITISSVIVAPCDGLDAEVTLAVSGTATSDSFDMAGNGIQYGRFAYADSPISVTVTGDCSTIYEFGVTDANDTNCQTATQLPDVICCDTATCDIAILSTTVGICDSTFVSVLIALEANAAASDSFALRGNGVEYGQYAYLDSPVEVFVEADCSTLYEFIAIDSDDMSCMSSTGLADVVCCDTLACTVSIGNIQVGNCDGETAPIAIIVDANDAGSDSFALAGNGMNYGTFAYADSPIIVNVSGDCSTIYEFVITDQNDSDCTDALELSEPICCDTSSCVVVITNVVVGDCDDSLATITLSVEGNASSADSFALAGNGMNYGSFAYADSPIEISVFGDCATIYEFVATDQLDSECMDVAELAEPICCGDAPCEIEIVGFTIGDCDADSIVVVSVNVVANDQASEDFNLSANGVRLGTFNYNDSPIEIELNADCSTLYTFEVSDGEESNCGSTLTLTEPICCGADTSCTLTVFDIEAGNCVDGEYEVTFDILGSNLSGEYSITIDGQLLGNRLSGSGPFSLGGLIGGDTVVITITDILLECSDSFVVVEDCSTSIEETEISKTQIYSYNETIYVRSASKWWTRAVIYGVDGRVLYSGDLADQEINIYDWNGLAIVQLYSPEGSLVERVYIR